MSYSFLLNLGSGVKIDKDSMLQCICSVKDQISGTQGFAECVAYVLITFCDLSLYRGTVPWNLFILNDKKMLFIGKNQSKWVYNSAYHMTLNL